MACINAEEAREAREFKVLLNAKKQDIQKQLEEFKKACDEHERQTRKRCKRRYYNLGLMARVVTDTTDDELRRLLKNGTRTFLVDLVTNKPSEFDEIVARTMDAINTYQLEDTSVRLIASLAVECHGDSCRLGRMRNKCSVLLQRGEIITLTTDKAYKYSCFKEIAYVINLKHYLNHLKLNEMLSLGREVKGRVVKKLRDNIAVLVDDAGIISSYEYIELPTQCYVITPEHHSDLFITDFEIAQRHHAHYLVMPKMRCKRFLSTVSTKLKEGYNFKLIGSIDLDYASARMLDIMGIITHLDFLWITDMFSVTQCVQKYILADVLPIAKCLGKPIIGSVPLERCSDFKSFENHDFLWKIDTIFIEKSPWCNKYPLIVKKLLPIRDFHEAVVENYMTLKEILTSYDSIVNFVIRTICTIECQAIILHSRCEPAALALGRVEIYCPVYVMLPLKEDDVNEQECQIYLARAMNFRRNLRGIMYQQDANECGYKPIAYGIDYLRRTGLLETADFIVTIEVCKEDLDNPAFGVEETVVILRAYYLPPLKLTEKYKYA